MERSERSERGQSLCPTMADESSPSSARHSSTIDSADVATALPVPYTARHASEEEMLREGARSSLPASQSPSASTTVNPSESASFRSSTLRIDVNAAERSPSVILTSPLAMCSTKKQPLNAHRSHPIAELTGNQRALPHLYGSPFLEYGMIVSLVCDDRNGVISAEGFASREVRLEKLNVRSEPSSGATGNAKLGLGGRQERKIFEAGGIRLTNSPFRDCLFEIVPKMTYDATLALQDVLALDSGDRKHTGMRTGPAVPVHHSLADLKFKSDAEIRLNAAMYRKLKGTQVTYGHAIQLRHVKSGLYVLLDTTPLPFRGREHAQVCLGAGSPRAQFNVIPRFKLRTKGAPVQMTDQLVLTSASDAQLYSLYVSNRAGDLFTSSVVGSSVHTSHWRAVLYEKHEDNEGRARENQDGGRRSANGIRAGTCVRLFHLESNSWLQCGTGIGGDRHPPVNLQYSDINEENVDEDRGDLTLSSDTLWELERASTYEGGSILWENIVCLRHILTGRYLAVSSSFNVAHATPRSPVMFRVPTRDQVDVVAYEIPQTFRLMPTAVADEKDHVENDAVVLLQHLTTQSFVHSPETHASSMTDIRISSKSLSKYGDTVSSFPLVALHGARDEDAFKIVAVSQSELDDTLLLISFKQVLREFVVRMASSVSKAHNNGTRDLNIFNQEDTLGIFHRVEDAIADLIMFCVEAANRSTSQLRSRQNMLRTHGYIDLLMHTIKAPFQRYGGPFLVDEVSTFNSSFTRLSKASDDSDEEADVPSSEVRYSSPSPGKPSSLQSQQRGRRGDAVMVDDQDVYQSHSLHQITERGARESNIGSGNGPRSDVRMMVMQSVNRIILASNTLLVHVFYGNRANELQVVESVMPILMELLGNGFQASLPLSYLLRENRNLVESITAYGSIIRKFFELIKSRGRSIRFMQFLVALCTSRGRGVPKTQEAICEFLFNKTNGYHDYVVVPFRPSSGGFELFFRGSSSRCPDEEQTNYEDMFCGEHGTWMDLASFYKDYYLHNKNRGFGQYCYGLLQLYVALCLDRNYVSIEYIQNTFPREKLLACVKDPNLSRSIRAILLNLIRVAYIDCEPQKVVTCPNLTRIWTDIGAQGSEAVPAFSVEGYSADDISFFTQIKFLCFSYIGRLRGKIEIDETPQNQLTLAIVQVCKKMVEFGMYSTQQDLSKLVIGFVEILDERFDSAHDRSSPRRDYKQQPMSKWRVKKLSSPTNSAPAIRGRRDSVTNSVDNLFTTLLSSVPHQGLPTSNPRSAVYDSDIRSACPVPPSRLHGNHVTLLDKTLPISTGSAGRDPVLQYGAEISTWIQQNEERSPAGAIGSGVDQVRGKKYMVGGSSPRDTAIPSGYLRRPDHTDINNHVCIKGGVSRHQMTDQNRIVMDIKNEICEILQLVDNGRLDYQISVFFTAFRAWLRARENGNSTKGARYRRNAVDGVADNIRSAGGKLTSSQQGVTLDRISPLSKLMFGKRSLSCKFSLSQLARRDVTTVLMQMLMYEYPPLVSKALELLLQQFNQHDQLLKTMQNVQLLVSTETIAIYNRLKDDVDELRRLCETTEVWMDLTSKSDFEKAELASSLLKSIQDVVAKHPFISRSMNVASGGSQSPNEDAPHTPQYGIKATDSVFARAQENSKAPPNRKLRNAKALYNLDYALGCASKESSCHQILPFARRREVPDRLHTSRSGANALSEGKRLLRNLKADQYVVSMMLDGEHFYEAHYRRQTDTEVSLSGREVSQVVSTEATEMLKRRQRDQIESVFKDAMKFLCGFCNKDPENQILLAPHVAMIARYVGDHEIAQQLLVSIYAHNRQMYKMLPTEVVNIFVHRITEDPGNPRYLYFLESLVLCDEEPIHENQLLVLFQMVKSLKNGVILQLFDNANKTTQLFAGLFNRYFNALRGDMNVISALSGVTKRTPHAAHTAKPKTPVSENDDLQSDSRALAVGSNHDSVAKDSRILEYHTRLLHLFAACAIGKNTKCQAICQQIIPLSVVLDLLSLPHCTEGLQYALLRFLNQVFLVADDTDAPDDELLFRVLAQLSDTCVASVFGYLQDLQNQDVNRKARISLQKTKNAEAKSVFARARGPLESTTMCLLIHALLPTALSYLRDFPHMTGMNDEPSEEVTQFFHGMMALLAVCPMKDWSLDEDSLEVIEAIVYILDKPMYYLPSSTSTSFSLTYLWTESLTRSTRPDLSSVVLDTTLRGFVGEILAQKDQDDRVQTPVAHRKHSGCVSEHDSERLRTDLHLGRRRHSSTASDQRAPISRAEQQNYNTLALPHHISSFDSRPNLNSDLSTPPEKVQLSTRNITKEDTQGGSKQLSTAFRRQGILRQLRLPRGLKMCRPASSTKSQKRSTSPYSRQAAYSVPYDMTSGSRYRNLFNRCRVATLPSGHGHQQQNTNDFDQFLWGMCSDPRIDSAIRDELNFMVENILSVEATLRSEFDPITHISNVALTFDKVVSKLVAHVQAFQDSNYVKTNVILLDVFYRMITAINDKARRHAMQVKLNQLGVTQLVVQLIATRDDDAIFRRCIELGVALLDGMNTEVQETFHTYWMESSNGLFFGKIQSQIDTACKQIRNSSNQFSSVMSPVSLFQPWSNKPEPPRESLPTNTSRRSMFGMEMGSKPIGLVLPLAQDTFEAVGGSTTSIFRFLQLLCEGHYLSVQRCLISQPHAKETFNLVETTTSFLVNTYLTLADADIGLVIQLFDTITEFCQGPCIEAQETVANFKFLSVVNALMMHSFGHTSPENLFLIRKLRASVVVTLLSLLEGRRDHTIHSHLAQELHFDALQRNLVEVYQYFLTEHDGTYAGNVECSNDFYIGMGFDMYILLRRLADSFPTIAEWIPRCSSADTRGLYDVADNPSGSISEYAAAGYGNSREYHDAFHFFQSNCASVEIMWNPQRHGMSSLSGDTSLFQNHGSHGAASANDNDPDDNEARPSDRGCLIPYYFPLHPLCFGLTDQSKKKLVWQVSRGSNKLHDFFARCDKLVDEMAHQNRLQSHRLILRLVKQSEFLKRISFALAIAINLMVLLFYQADGIESAPYAASQVTFVVPATGIHNAPSQAIEFAISLAGGLQLVLSCTIMACYLINSAPLLIKKGWKRRVQYQQELLSKKTASAHRLSNGNDEKMAFQNSEQLLRSLREREEEYDYFFFPPRVRRALRVAAKDESARLQQLASVSHRRTRHPSGPSKGASEITGVCGSILRALFPPNCKNEEIQPQAIGERETGFFTLATLQYIQVVATSLSFVLVSPRVLYYLWQIVIAILGTFVHNLYFAFHLLDIVNRYPALSNVLRSIVRPAKVLGATVLLYLVIVYVFAIVGFYFFREDYNPTGALTPGQRAGSEPYQCQRLFQCFLTSLDQGFKSDGGLGGYLKQHSLGMSARSYGRLVFDLLYNTVLLIMLLNIVFGVIIDTFASLRTADSEKATDMQSRCFICSIDAYTFDRGTKRGFHDHIYMEHNMWHYLYLFVHIRKKPITEYNGIELYLAMRMAKKDVSFFPTHRALSLENADHNDGSGLNMDVDMDMRARESSALSPLVSDGRLRHRNDRDGLAAMHQFDPFSSSLQRSDSQPPLHLRTRRLSSGGSVTKPSSFNAFAAHDGRAHSHYGPLTSASRSGHSSSALWQSLDRVIAAKVEQMETTIDSLLSSQLEMQQQLARSSQRQMELIDMLARTQSAGMDRICNNEVQGTSLASTGSNGGVLRSQTVSLQPTLTGNGTPRRHGSGSLASPSASPSFHDPRRRAARPGTGVFTFDSVTQDYSKNGL